MDVVTPILEYVAAGAFIVAAGIVVAGGPYFLYRNIREYGRPWLWGEGESWALAEKYPLYRFLRRVGTAAVLTFFLSGYLLLLIFVSGSR